MINDSIFFVIFIVPLSSLVVALFVKLLEHVKHLERPQRRTLDDSRELPDLDQNVDEEPDDSLIYDGLFHS
jgi:hypothetical protein